MVAASLVKLREEGRGLQFQEKVLRPLASTLSKDSLSTSWTNNSNQFTIKTILLQRMIYSNARNSIPGIVNESNLTQT